MKLTTAKVKSSNAYSDDLNSTGFGIVIHITLLAIGLLFVTPAVFGQQNESFTTVKLYTNLYTQTENFDQGGSRITDTARRSFVTNILELNFFNPQKKIDWGIDAYFRASRDHSSNDSPLETLRYENNGRTAQTSFSHIGPKLSWRFSEKIPGLSSKFILLIPLGQNGQNLNSSIPSLDNTGVQFWSQLNYNGKLAEQLYGYAELSVVARLGRDALPHNDVFIPFKVFLSYFPLQAVGIFSYADYTPTITNPSAFYFQAGGGLKIFPSPSWEIELSGGSFLAGKNTGAGYSLNLGLAYKIPSKKNGG